MADVSSIKKSDLKFETYKVDHLQLTMKPDLNLLAMNGTIEAKLWDINVAIKIPIFFKEGAKYVGGVEMTMDLYQPQQEKKDEHKLISLTASITGLFSTLSGERLDKTVEKKFVVVTIPAILLPHLRATLSGLFAMSGYGTVTLPLINVAAMAEETLDKIEIIEH